MTKQSTHTIIGVLFVISGASGLVYQIVWFKYLALFLGNTTYAQTIVLATFMGGLALGAARWGRKADKSKNALALYAWLEIGIGIYCLTYPSLLELLKNGFIGFVQNFQLASDGTGVLVLKLLVSFISLFLPTVFMGGTLPVLVRHISERLEESGRNVAILYFLNSLGAVGGSLLGGFFLVRILGLSTTIYVSAVANLLVGGIAFFLGRKALPQAYESEKPGVEIPETPIRQVRLAVITAGVSGLAAMVYEVSWVRLLIPVFGSSTYSFSVMLVSFIAGITIGSLIISSLIQRIKDRLMALALCQLGAVASMLVTLPMYARLPYYFWHAANLLNRVEAAYPVFLVIQFAFVFFIMIVPTIFLGMSLPLASRIATRSFPVLGTAVGNVFSFNTIGTVVGALAAGLVLIPLIGVRHAVEVGIGSNTVMGFLLLWTNENKSRFMKIVLTAGVMMFAVFYFLVGGIWSRGVAVSGVFRLIAEKIPPLDRYEDFRLGYAAARFLYYREGPTATVAVTEGQFQGKKQEVLIVNGKADASSVGDLPTQSLIAHLPLVFHPSPRNVFIVGLGSGMTGGSVLTHPVERVDCAEISPEVVEASKYFNAVNRRPLEDPRFHLYVEDALAFLKLTPETYDVIVSEPSNPWIAGIGNLFTIEFFEQCRRKLRPGGMVVQWFHLYEMDDELTKLVLRTFQRVFPSVTVWQAQATDIMILGSDGQLPLQPLQIEKAMARKSVAEDLARIGILHPATFLSMQILSDQSTREYADFGEVNTDDMPHLEYAAPRVFFVNRGVRELQRVDERMNLGSSDILLAHRIQSQPLTDDELLNIGMLHTTSIRGNLTFGYAVLLDYVNRHPDNIEALKNLAAAAEQMRRFDESVKFREQIARIRPQDPDALEKYAWEKFSRDRSRANLIRELSIREYEDLLTKSIELVSDTVDRYRVRLADVYFTVEQFQKAEDNYRRALKIREDYEPDLNIAQDVLLLQLAKCLKNTGKPAEALTYALQAAQINPRNEDAKNFVYAMWMNGGTSKRDSTMRKL